MASVLPTEFSFDPSATPPEPVKRWTVTEYHELIRLGILKEGDPYELIEGWLVTKMTNNPPHDAKVNFLNQYFVRLIPADWSCRIQSAISLLDGEPEPDLAIVKGSPLTFDERHPIPADIGLIIEVSDTSYVRDSTIKLRPYARAGIVENWIVNLLAKQFEVYSAPDSQAKQPNYTQQQIYRKGMDVPCAIGGKLLGSIPVSDLL